MRRVAHAAALHSNTSVPVFPGMGPTKRVALGRVDVFAVVEEPRAQRAKAGDRQVEILEDFIDV